jgi:hypothetical protein
MDIFLRAKERAYSEEIKAFCAEQKIEPRTISYHAIDPKLPPLLVGVIRRRPRRSDGEEYAVDHPMRLFWEAAKALNRRRELPETPVSSAPSLKRITSNKRGTSADR